jgi:hypothetical protein
MGRLGTFLNDIRLFLRHRDAFRKFREGDAGSALAVAGGLIDEWVKSEKDCLDSDTASAACAAAEALEGLGGGGLTFKAAKIAGYSAELKERGVEWLIGADEKVWNEVSRARDAQITMHMQVLKGSLLGHNGLISWWTPEDVG